MCTGFHAPKLTRSKKLFIPSCIWVLLNFNKPIYAPFCVIACVWLKLTPELGFRLKYLRRAESEGGVQAFNCQTIRQERHDMQNKKKYYPLSIDNDRLPCIENTMVKMINVFRECLAKIKHKLFIIFLFIKSLFLKDQFVIILEINVKSKLIVLPKLPLNMQKLSCVTLQTRLSWSA